MRKKSPKAARKSKTSVSRGRIFPQPPAATAGTSAPPPSPEMTKRRSDLGPSSKRADSAVPSPNYPAVRRRGPLKIAQGQEAGAASAGDRPAGRKRAFAKGGGRRTEWSLMACEEYFRSLVELSPDAIFIHQEGKFLLINPAGVRLYGAKDAGEMIGRSVLDLVHPDYREFVRNRIELSYHLKRSTTLQDSRIVRLDGTAVPVEATSAPVVVKGRPATLVILRDTTGRRKAEESLRLSESQLRAVFNAPNVVLGILEDHGDDILIVNANAELSSLYQVKPGALNGRYASQFGAPREVIREQLRRYEAARQSRSVETWEYHRTWAGRQQWFLASASYIGKGPEGWHRYTLVAQDITGRKRAEEALQRSHDELERRVRERTERLQQAYARISMVLESITVGFFAVDGDFRLTYVNNEVARMWGRERKDLVGRKIWEAVPQARGTIFEEQYRKAVVEKTPVSFEAQLLASGRWLEVKAYPSEEGLYIFLHDITARRLAEEERIRLESAISSAAEMVVITDHRGMIQYVNPAFERITGYSRAEAIGGTMHVLDSGRHDEAFYHELRSRLQRDRSWEGRFISRKRDGTLYFEDCTLSLVVGKAGDIRNYVSVRRDVTERLRLESIAESVDAMNNVGYIFSGVRHEIGNPVNTAKMILAVLEQKLGTATKEAVADYVARAMGEIDKVENLLRNLRNFNLYETQEPQVVMTAPFLDAFLRLITDELAQKGISLSHRVGPGAEEIIADPRALQQVLLNLVTNAMDAVAGREGALIDIEATASRGTIHLRITDNGRGMSEEEQKNLFRPFFTTKPGGTGLGLVIVRKMLAQMGGTIEITSRRESGTLAEVTLVRRSDAEAAEEGAPSSSTGR